MPAPADLPYDYEDFGMEETELREKYADTGFHPHHDLVTYSRCSEKEQDQFNGYWDWVYTQIRKDEKIY